MNEVTKNDANYQNIWCIHTYKQFKIHYRFSSVGLALIIEVWNGFPVVLKYCEQHVTWTQHWTWYVLVCTCVLHHMNTHAPSTWHGMCKYVRVYYITWTHTLDMICMYMVYYVSMHPALDMVCISTCVHVYYVTWTHMHPALDMYVHTRHMTTQHWTHLEGPYLLY